MNFTVGPLPPSVYWRRRAFVAGAIVLVIVLLAYSCSGSGGSGSSNTAHTPASHAASGVNAPVGIVSPASSAPVVPSQPPSLLPSAPPSLTPSMTPTATPHSAPPATNNGMCTDAQIQVTPVISATSSASGRLIHGGTFDLKLKVRNISHTTCKRDVGSVPEELRVTSGKTKIWSSDDCVKTHGKAHDIRTFAPNIQIYADVKWDTYDITTHSCQKSAYPAKTGTYTLTGRVGTKSATTTFKIVG